MTKINPIPRESIIPPLTPLLFQSHPVFLPPESSPVTFSIQKPSLAHPDTFKEPHTSLISATAAFLTRLEHVDTAYFNMIIKEMDHFETLSSHNIEQKALHQTIEQKEKAGSDFWDFLKKVAAYVLGAASIVLGIMVLGAETSVRALLAGGAMILSGGASICGSLLSDLKIQPQVATALTLTGSALGLVGSVSTLTFGSFSLTEVLGRVVTSALAIASHSAEILKEGHNWTLSNEKAAYTQTEKMMKITEEGRRALEKDMAFFGEALSQSTENCIAVIEQNILAMKQINARTGPQGAV